MATIKLRKFDSSYVGGRVAKATISIHSKGRIALSPLAMEMMGLKMGNKISLFQDESEPRDWYIGKDADGIELRDCKDSGFVSSRLIATKFMESIEYNGGGGACDSLSRSQK